MTLNEMITILRQHLSDEQDIGWPWDAELIAYLDRGSAYLSNQLIIMKDCGMLKKLFISGLTDLPADFAAFVGNVPVVVTGRQCECYDEFHTYNEPRWGDGIEQWPGGRFWNEEEPEGLEENMMHQNIEVLYWAMLPVPSSFPPTDPLPYTPEQATLIIEMARLFALNKNEYDLSQDMNLMNEVSKAMAAVRKG